MVGRKIKILFRLHLTNIKSQNAEAVTMNDKEVQVHN